MIVWIAAAFEKKNYEHYAQKPGCYRIGRSQNDYANALVEIDFPPELPDDLRKMIAFLWVDGFFEHYQISVWSWLHSSGFQRPDLVTLVTNQKPIMELMKSEAGLDSLRASLADLFWWQWTRGDLQGT